MNTYEEFLAEYGGPPEKDFFSLSTADKTAIIYNQVTKRINELRESGRLSPEQNLDPMGIVAQILTETGNATSALVKQANNFGGLVADKGWKGAKSPSGKYRSYSTPEEGLRAQVDFYVENPRYTKAGVLNARNAQEHLQAVNKAGYAESPDYLENTLKTLKSIPGRLEKANKELLKSFELPKENLEDNSNFIPQTFTIKQSGYHDPLLLEHPITITPDFNTQPIDINLMNAPIEVPPPFEQQQYKNGGTMNFKSKAAYKNYLGYIYANNLNKPGGAPVTIKGKHHEVDRGDQFGGYLLPNGGLMYGNGEFAMGPAFAMGGSFNNPGFKALPKQVQAKIKANSFAEGGDMNQLTEFNAGGTHEENPLGGIPQGMAPDGQPNLVEQGETKLNAKDYIFSDRLKIDKQIAEEFNLPKNYIGKTFAEASKKTDRPDSRRENDTIELNAKEKELNILMEAQEAFKAKEVAKKMEEINSLDPTALQGMGQPQIPQSISPMGMPQGQPVDPSQIPPEMLAQMPAAQQGAPIMAMGGHIYMCGGHRYDFGSFMKDTGDFLGNYGKGLADASLSTLGMKDVISDDMYKGKSANLARKTAGIVGGINAAVAPAVMNMVLPGSGALVSGVQNSLGQATAKPVEQPTVGLTPEQIAQQEEQTKLQHDNQMAGLYSQYGSINPNNYQGYMANGGHMFDGNPGKSSFLNNFGLNTDYATAVANYSPYTYNTQNPFTGFNMPRQNSFIPESNPGISFLFPGNGTGQAFFAEAQVKPLAGNENTGIAVEEPDYAALGVISPAEAATKAALTLNNDNLTEEDILNNVDKTYSTTNSSEDLLGNPFATPYKNPLTGQTALSFNSYGTGYNNEGVTSGNRSPLSTSTGEGTTGTTYPGLSDSDNMTNITGNPLTTIGTLGSIGYNAYMALKKPKEQKLEDYYTPVSQIEDPRKLTAEKVKLERMNYTPALQSAERTTSAALMAARKGGDTGTYLNMLNTLRGGYGEQAGNIAMEAANKNAEIGNTEANINAQRKLAADQYNIDALFRTKATNADIAAKNAAARAAYLQYVTEYNAKQNAARQEHTKAIFNDLFNLGQVTTANQLGAAYANMQAPKGQGINYTPYLQSLFSKNNE